MAKSSVYKRGGRTPGFNMTPMIDCTFQLLIFFMLTTQVASSEFAQMKLPEPDRSAAREVETRNRAVVNVAPFPDKEIERDPHRLGKAKGFYLKGEKLDRAGLQLKLTTIRDDLAARGENPGEFAVELRADYRIHYSEIEPVMQTLQAAGLANLHITAIRPRSGGGS